jgi:hypothetical protein
MATDDLRAFIEARLAEDERAALAIKPELRGWQTAGGWPEHYPTKVVSGEVLIVDDDADMATEVMPHIVRHDPARVLREVAAKRALLLEIDSELADDPSVIEGMTGDRLQIMASVWSDHPDFRTEWA